MTNALVLAAAAVAVLAAISAVADRRFQDRETLPMQWSLSGQVNWSAPRRVALSFTPVLAAIALLPIAVLSASAAFGLATLAFAAATFVAVHLLHLRLIAQRRAS